MTTEETMSLAVNAAYELGAAVAVKQAADDFYRAGQPEAAQYLLGHLAPAHQLLLSCMKEAADVSGVR